jgi:quinoprotein glucose dehydrogenase
VAKGDVPNEWYAPTQPFVTKPPAYDRQGVSIDDLIDFTPELRAEAIKQVAKYKIGPIFTPPTVSKIEGPLGTLVLPSATGGTNWPGGSYDPETHTVFVYSQTNVSALGLLAPPDVKVSDMNFVQGSAAVGVRANGGSGAGAGADSAPVPAAPPAAAGGEGGGAGVTVQGLPLIKPPYGRITAIDLDKGTIKWQIAHGETLDNVKNNPALKGVTIPRTGQAGIIGTLATKSLVIAGESRVTTTSAGMRGAMLRAYDKADGKEVGAVYLPAPQSGSPMTYQINGKQYIVVAVSGGNYSGEYIAFKLPG